MKKFKNSLNNSKVNDSFNTKDNIEAENSFNNTTFKKSFNDNRKWWFIPIIAGVGSIVYYIASSLKIFSQDGKNIIDSISVLFN